MMIRWWMRNTTTRTLRSTKHLASFVKLISSRLLTQKGLESCICTGNHISTILIIVFSRIRRKRIWCRDSARDSIILFPFGAIGAFPRVNDGSYSRSKFDSQCLLGIALGRSEFTNGMIFYNPIPDSFCTSADFLIDKNRHIGEAFPSIRYDGG